MWVGLTLKEKKWYFWTVELKVFCLTDFCPVFSELCHHELPLYYIPTRKEAAFVQSSACLKLCACRVARTGMLVNQLTSSTAVSQGWVMTTFPTEVPAIPASACNTDSDLYKTLRNLIIFETFIPNFNLNQLVSSKVTRKLFLDWNTGQCDRSSFLFLRNWIKNVRDV